MSKSMDNFFMRPVSYSGFNNSNLMPSPIVAPNIVMNQPRIPINQPNIVNTFQSIPNFTNPPIYPITNQPIIKNPAYQLNPSTKIPNKQL